MNKIQGILLTAAVLTGFLLRTIRLDYIPVSLSNDEISIAYDAYSVGETLRDEHNHFLPLSFQSHNTYKAPLTGYLSIPFVKILGNNEYGARLSSAVLGTGTIALLGLLAFYLSSNAILGAATAWALALTPWHINSSRMALESNVALFFVVLGVFFFYKGVIEKSVGVTIAAFVSLAVSQYGYHTEWGLVPLLIGGLFLFYFRAINKKIFFAGGLVWLLVITPMLIDYMINPTNTRANTQLITGEIGLAQQLSSDRYSFLQKGQLIAGAVLGNYSAYMHPEFLFFKGMNLLPAGDPFQVGLFLWPTFILFILGLFSLKKYFKKDYGFLYYWAAVSPLIPALTKGGAVWVRDLVSAAPYCVVIGAGICEFIERTKKAKWVRYLGAAAGLSALFNFVILYYFIFPLESGENFQYGYKQAAEVIKNEYGNYEKIVVDPRFGDENLFVGVPHLYLSYFMKLDPNYLLKRKDNGGGVYFDKFEIREINWNLEKVENKYLYLVPTDNQPERINELKVLKEIDLPNGKPEFWLYRME